MQNAEPTGNNLNEVVAPSYRCLIPILYRYGNIYTVRKHVTTTNFIKITRSSQTHQPHQHEAHVFSLHDNEDLHDKMRSSRIFTNFLFLVFTKTSCAFVSNRVTSCGESVLPRRLEGKTLTQLSDRKEGSWDRFDAIRIKIISSPRRSTLFSVLMASAGAVLGPFLDAYHSAFGVLQYDNPITAQLWGSPDHPALITSWWVPELFGLAGFLIGWLYMIGDEYFKPSTKAPDPKPSAPSIFLGISLFTLQYWLSGAMVLSGVDRITILNVMSLISAVGFLVLDWTEAGFFTSAATAIGGPLIEVGLLSLSRNDLILGSGYHYTDLGETGFFPLWILPVYFLGGPANGNLARGLWNGLTETLGVEDSPVTKEKAPPGCLVCSDTRRVPCPACDGVGQYVAIGGRKVDCPSCRGRGFVICRECFSHYDEDPSDIEAIRELMSRMPD